jgi:hypothetical protein
MQKFIPCAATLALALATPAFAQQLFVAQDAGAAEPPMLTDLAGFPAVSYSLLAPFEVNGAAGRFDGSLYICSGFSGALYTWDLVNPPQQIATSNVSGLSALAYAPGHLYGFGNFASPMGIYEINPATGAGTLVLDTSAQGYRFFGLDYNPADGLLYGFTEYGTTGLYRINVSTGEMTRLAGTPPGSYGMFRGLGVGNNTAYLCAAHPTDTFYAYDLSQGVGGTYVPFNNPYTNSINGAGAWVEGTPQPPINDNCAAAINVGEGIFAFDNRASTTDGSASSCGGGFNDVWYRYTPTVNGEVTIETCGRASFDTMLSAYDTCYGTELACNDDACDDVTSQITLNVTQGVPVIIRFASYSPGDTGSGSIRIFSSAPPANDNCANATPVSEGVFPFDTTNATTDGTNSCGFGGDTGGKDVWWRYTPSASGSATIYNCGQTSLDSQISAIATCGGPDLACSEDNCGTQSTITLDVTAGQPILVRLAGWRGAPGSGTITIDLEAGCAADFNGDNQVDFFDYLDFAQAFNDEDPSADFNGDNQIDFFDYLDFALAFDAGC